MRLSGRNAEIKITIGAGSAMVVPMASYTANMETERTDATNFGDPNKVEVQGLPSVSGDFSGFYETESSFQLFAASQAPAPPTLSIAIDKINYPTLLITGPANISATLTQSVNGAVEVSGNWSAAGAFDLDALLVAPVPAVP